MKPNSPHARRRHQKWVEVRRWVREFRHHWNRSWLGSDPAAASKACEGGMSCTHYPCHKDKIEQVPRRQERREWLRGEVDRW